MVEEGFCAAGVPQLMPVFIRQARAFIIVVSWRAFGIPDQHTLSGKDKVYPLGLRRGVWFDLRKPLTFGMCDDGRNRVGVIDDIVRHV